MALPAANRYQLHQDDGTRRHEDTKGYFRIEPVILVISTGDRDNSGTTDICLHVQIYGNTSAQNTPGYGVAWLIVTWADGNGRDVEPPTLNPWTLNS